MKYVVTLNGKNYEVEVEETDAVITAVTDAAPAAPAAAAEGQKVLSPMPGTILSVNVNVGSSVKAGDILLILEAMKMENEIRSLTDGTVKEIFVEDTAKVGLNDRIMVIE